MVPKIQSETEFFVILGHFLPFNPKNQNFEKMKKKPRDTIIFTNVCHQVMTII